MYKRNNDNNKPSSSNAQNSNVSSPGPWSVRAEFTIHRTDTSSPVETTTRTASIAPSTESSGVRMTYSFTPSQPAPTPSYGFQRGNMTFTSIPPTRAPSSIPVRSHTIPRTTYSHRVQHEQHVTDSGYASEQHVSRQPSDKRCRSTYDIVLSSAKRAMAYPRPWTSYRQQQHLPSCCYFKERLPEVREDFPTVTTMSKDTATQTTDIEAKMSPVAARKKVVRRKTPAVLRGDRSSLRDESRSDNFGRLAKPTPVAVAAPPRSPTPPPPAPTLLSSSSSSAEEEESNAKEDDSSEKRKRTVHIDVYCTGTEDDDDDDDDDDNRSSSSNDSATQSTVFESSDVRVTHIQANPDILPRGFQDEKAFLKRASERRCESFRHAPMRMPSLASSKGYESDDVLSSLYPSQFSSYSRLRDFESSIAWSAASSRSGITEDSVATSWKDTEVSVTPCDSFDYADSLDKERIRRMATPTMTTTNWKSPSIERKHLLQGKMMRDYLERNKPVGWSSESSADSSDADESAEEVGWSFVSSEENSSVVQGKLTLPAKLVDRTMCTKDENKTEMIKEVKTMVFRDRIGPFGSTSPSPPLSKVQSRMTSPFTTPQGERTDHILKASIFGRVVNTFRKPGHHVGPAKNPSCSCEHCRRHFEDVANRVRSRSLDTVGRRRSSSNNPTSSTN